MPYAICDIQMLRGKYGEYVLKEVSFYEQNESAQVHKSATFAPPYPGDEIPEKQKRQNKYIVRRLHSLPWETGFSPYDRLPQTLSEMSAEYDFLYVKGDEKKRILQFLLPSKRIFDVEKFGCPSLKKLPKAWAPCHNDTIGSHSSKTCAARNAKRVGLWMQVYLNSPN